MTHIKSNDPYFCGYNEDDDTADYIVLKISVVVIAISNIIVNLYLYGKYVLPRKEREQTPCFLFLVYQISLLA